IVVVTASDGTLTGSYTFTWTVGNRNRPPTLAPIGNLSTSIGATITRPVAGSDPDGDSVNYSATGLPQGVAIDPATGVISGAPSIAGIYAVTITASDVSASGTA